MGYTHKIVYEKYVKSLDMWVECSFRTVGVMVQVHEHTCKENKEFRNVKVVKL